MLRLKELTFSGIGRFVSEQSIDFTSKTNLIQVNGKNLNTGGSSGSAKSTVFHALDYLLGINEIPATALQNRKTKDTLRVSGIFDKDGKVYRIERSKKKGLCLFEINGSVEEPLCTGSTSVAEEKLDQILGLPRDLVSKLSHKKQSEGGFFLNLRPKAIYDFLAKCLDLESYNQKILQISLKIKDLEEKENAFKNKITQNTSLLSNLESLKLGLTLPEKDFSDLEKERIQFEKAELSKEIEKEKHQNKINLAILDHEKPSNLMPPLCEGKLEALRQELNKAQEEYKEELSSHSTAKLTMVKKKSELESILKETKRSIQEKQRLEHNKTALEQEILILEGSYCPTCQQKWVGEQIQKKIIDKKQELITVLENIKIHDQKILTIDTQELVLQKLSSLIDRSSMSERLPVIQERLDKISVEVRKEEQKLNDQRNVFTQKQSEEWSRFNLLVAQENRRFETKLSVLNDTLNVLNIQERELEIRSFNYQKNLDNYHSQIAKISSQMGVCELELVTSQTNITELLSKKEAYQESSRCIKSYLLTVFQDSLDYIGTKATQMLSKIPHTSNTVIYFETGKENKDGTIKEEITAYVNLESDSNIPICTLCGGERSAIDLAVDLAVNDLIESRSGKGFDWIVLDEPFDGNDSIGKEACLDILSNTELNRRIIVVDHGTELKSMIPDMICVVREGEESRIE